MPKILNLDKELVIEKYYETESSRKVAKHFKVSLGTILKILHDNDISTNIRYTKKLLYTNIKLKQR